MMSGVYVGPIEHLKGERALLQYHDLRLTAQFNNVELKLDVESTKEFGGSLGYGWHEFAVTDFKIDPVLGNYHQHNGEPLPVPPGVYVNNDPYADVRFDEEYPEGTL